MKLTITHQEQYSRSELLLRSIFGVLYITLPHAFLLFFVGLWGLILNSLLLLLSFLLENTPKAFLSFKCSWCAGSYVSTRVYIICLTDTLHLASWVRWGVHTFRSTLSWTNKQKFGFVTILLWCHFCWNPARICFIF